MSRGDRPPTTSPHSDVPPAPQPLAVDVDTDGVRIPLARARVAGIAREVLRQQRVKRSLLSIAFVNDREIARLNREHLRHTGTTDVISFALPAPVRGAPVIGDIYIAPSVVRAQAIDRGRPIREEFTRVVVHGVLHVLGHDHPGDGAREESPMWRLQERLVASILSAPGR